MNINALWRTLLVTQCSPSRERERYHFGFGVQPLESPFSPLRVPRERERYHFGVGVYPADLLTTPAGGMELMKTPAGGFPPDTF